MPRKYESHPCPICQNITSKKNVCSLKCYTELKPKKEYFCCICKTSLGKGWTNKTSKYCNECKKIHNKCFRDWSQTTIEQHFKNLPNFQANARIRSLARAVYKKSNQPKCCINCGYSKHYEVCHKKPISSFDRTTTISVVNDISNLVALCPNCHWEFDHGLLEVADKRIELLR